MTMVAAGMGITVGATGQSERAQIGVADAGLVLAGEFGATDLGVMTHAPTLPAGCRQALMVIDLRRLSVVVTPHAGHDETRIVVAGDLDLASAPMLDWALSFALDRQPDRIAVDLRRLEMIDARCAHALAGASLRMGEWGGALVTFGSQPSVRRVLQLCGLGELLLDDGPSPAHTHRFQEAGE